MNKQRSMTTKQLEQESRTRFDTGLLDLGPTAALWLADAILVETGRSVYRKIMQLRARHGKYTCFPEYGSALFDSLEPGS